MTTRTLYLHVGMDKTGTSAIQEFMYINRELIFKSTDLYYPHTGIWIDHSHHPFAFSILNLENYTENTLWDLLEKLTSEIESKNKVLISSECFLTATTVPNFNIFQKYIDNNFTQIKAIIYLRRQDLWLESKYKHCILSGLEVSLEELKKPDFLNYKQYIDQWARVVGKDNIIVKIYETSQFLNGSIFEDFCSIFGLTLTEEYIVPAYLVNSSLGVYGCEFKKMFMRLNSEDIDWSALNIVLLKYADIERRYKRKFLLSPAERLNVIKDYSYINKKIAINYLDREDGNLFSDLSSDSTELSELYNGLTREKILEIANYILKNNPELYNNLTEVIKKSLKSKKTAVYKISKSLKPILDTKKTI